MADQDVLNSDPTKKHDSEAATTTPKPPTNVEVPRESSVLAPGDEMTHSFSNEVKLKGDLDSTNNSQPCELYCRQQSLVPANPLKESGIGNVASQLQDDSNLLGYSTNLPQCPMASQLQESECNAGDNVITNPPHESQRDNTKPQVADNFTALPDFMSDFTSFDDSSHFEQSSTSTEQVNAQSNPDADTIQQTNQCAGPYSAIPQLAQPFEPVGYTHWYRRGEKRKAQEVEEPDETTFAGYEAEKQFTVNAREKLNNVLQAATKRQQKLYKFNNVQTSPRVWTSTLTLSWPDKFTVTGEGTTLKDAEKRASAVACMKLREKGIVFQMGNVIRGDELRKEEAPRWIRVPDNVLDWVESVLRYIPQQGNTHPNYPPPLMKTFSTPMEIRDMFTSGLYKQLSHGQEKKINEELLRQYTSRYNKKNWTLQQIQQVTSNLPVTKIRTQVTNLAEKNQVIVISGETGCGKTTQIPQFILDNEIQMRRGAKCNIVVTQPRRIVAMSIAERVAEERGEKLGQSVGYQVRLEGKPPKKPGRILFCTTGVLLRKMQNNPQLLGVSHVIVDEVHERDINTDFLLVLLRELLEGGSPLHIIVMSATVDSSRFSRYFRNCASLAIPGFTHPVTEYYLPEIKQMLPPSYEQNRSVYKLDEESSPEVDYDVVVQVLLHVSNTYPEGAILCFLAGWDEIMMVGEMFMDKVPEYQRSRYLVLPLHSMLPMVNQHQVFDRPAPGVRKIVLATNIAETSITIDDVVYVVNAGNLKEKTYDAQNEVSSLMTRWASKASVTQRRGRAGRCKPGYCFHLFTKGLLIKMQQYRQAEMLRMPLEEIIIQAKRLRPGWKAQMFLSKALDPPPSSSVKTGVSLLQDICALDYQENLTPLGEHISNLPVDPKIAKMIIFATIFRCLDPVLVIAASLGYKDPFVKSMHKRDQSDKARANFSAGNHSDHIAVLNAYNGWRESVDRGTEMCYVNSNYLHRGTLNMIQGMRDQFYQLLMGAGLVPMADDGRVSNMYGRNLGLVKGILCAGLYPNVIRMGLGMQSKGMGKKRLRLGFKTKPDGWVAMHPSSVNGGAQKQLESRWLVYHEKVKSSQVFIRDCSMVHPMALVMFGGKNTRPIAQGKGHVTIGVDGDRWISFHCDPRVANIVQGLRVAMETMITQTVSRNTRPDEMSYQTSVIEAVIGLLSTKQDPYTTAGVL